MGTEEVFAASAAERRALADDLDGAWGAGEVLAGRGIDVLMATCGRTAVLGRLRGAGVPVLRQRLARA